jgi:hypothetical protein
MGKIKTNKDNKHILSEREFDYLKILNLALSYSVFKDKVLSGYLYQVCTNRFGYAEDTNLQFEIDLDLDTRELTVHELPKEVVDQAIESA